MVLVAAALAHPTTAAAVADNMGGCQNYGPLLRTLDIRCRTIIGTQKGTIILTTTLLLLVLQLGADAAAVAVQGWNYPYNPL